MKILLLEDDVILNELIEEFLLGLNHEVICEFDGNDAIDSVYANTFDLLLLDVGVPNLNGFEVLQTVRESKINTPAIFLTSLNDSKSIEEGFDSGCSDYIKKPFELKELEVRINHIKKINNIEKNDIVTLSKYIQYDFLNHSILTDNKSISLSNKEYKILEFFIKNSNRIISVEELIVNVWDYESSLTNATIRTYIKNLRKLIAEDMIITIKGTGYRFET